ncbi:MAG: hypothetical protein EA351_14650 [Gemmatimonadales bacterium]|nr:MAG: hypothetical protein EA351_14650 [Gemmatimonadales bacterium]
MNSIRRSNPSPVLAPVLIIFGALLSACASAPAEEAPPVDAGQLGQQAEQASVLDGSYRLVFQWTLNEPGVRISGRGVARVEGPYRARLDLFTSNGERIAAAALVGDDLRIPAGMPNIIPMSSMLWASLGVFRPGPGMAPAGATLDGPERSQIRYRVAGGGELRADLLRRKLEHMEMRGADGVRQEVRLSLPAGERFPREAVYRHHGDVRELRMTLEQVEHVETYPSDVWNPGA